MPKTKNICSNCKQLEPNCSCDNPEMVEATFADMFTLTLTSPFYVGEERKDEEWGAFIIEVSKFAQTQFIERFKHKYKDAEA